LGLHLLLESKKDNKLIFIIYDKGKGIASSFRENRLYMKLADKDIIAKAMEKGITSTDFPGRGNGSENIKKPVMLFDMDIVRIFSESGCYDYSEGKGIQLAKLPISLPGTLIIWQIKVTDDD
jgi:hypothetical protein